MTKVNIDAGEVLLNSTAQDAFKITSTVVTSVKDSDNDTIISPEVVVKVLETANNLFIAQLANKLCGEDPVVNSAQVHKF